MHFINHLRNSMLVMTFVLIAMTSSWAKELLMLEKQCKEIELLWMDEHLDLIKNCVGFSAPVAARTLNYICIGGYESMVEQTTNYNSLSGQLAGYERTVWLTENQEVDFRCLLNTMNYLLAKFYFANMPPAALKKMELLNANIEKKYSSDCSKKTLASTKLYAEKLANEIINWSKLDGGDKGYSRNFPSSYQPAESPGAWVRTYPGYKPALLPYWGSNKLLLPNNGSICNDMECFPYSLNQDSELYFQANLVSELYKNITNEQEIIAEYWDDGPGITGTPVGHLFTVANNICKDSELPLDEYLEVMVLLGIALNDAVIEVWRLKYQFNLIRPITYIQQNIRKDFNTIVETPSFPEFPSGHSFQAGAGTEILKHFFTDQMPFVDSTNQKRKDIVGAPRTYGSFSEMAEEMSNSRFYGGIHYPKTLELSLQYGKLMGVHTIESLNLRK